MKIKMKRYISTLIAAAAVVTGCFEENHLEDSLPDSAVYFINSGYCATDTFYDVQKSVTVPVYAYCSGYYGGNPEVDVYVSEYSLAEYNKANGTSLKMLPGNCWSIDTGKKTMSDKKARFEVTFDCDALKELSDEPDLSDLSTYVIPLGIESLSAEVQGSAAKEEQTRMFLSPSMSPMSFIFKQAGTRDITYDDILSEDGKIHLFYQVYTPVDNSWENGVKFTFNAAGEDLKYDRLPEDCYTVSASSEAFSDGVSEIDYEVVIDESKADAVFYSIVATVESEGNFLISGGNISVMNLFNRIAYSQRKMSIASCNSYQNETYKAANILDGNTETFWHSAYNSSHVGVFGNVNFEIAVKMEDSRKLSAFSITRRSGTYASDLKAGYIEVSSDGETYTKAADFNFGTKSEFPWPGPLYVTCEPVEAQYVKIVMTESNRFAGGTNKLANIAEFNVYYK